MTGTAYAAGFGESPEVAIDDVPVRGEHARLAHRIADPQRARDLPGGSAALPALVRRTGDAAPVLVQRGPGLLRQPLPRDACLRGRARRGPHRLPGVRHRPVSIAVRAGDVRVRPAGDRQRQGEHRPGRRALPCPGRDPHPGPVRPRDAADGRGRRVGHLDLRADDHRASAPRRGAARGHQPRHPVRGLEQLRVPAGRHERSRPGRQHDPCHPTGSRTRVHPLVRDVREAPGDRGVPAGGEPDGPAPVAQAVHRELPVGAGTWHPIPRLRPGQRRPRAHGDRTRVLRLPSRECLRVRRRPRRRPRRLRRRLGDRGVLPAPTRGARCPDPARDPASLPHPACGR